MNQVWWGKESEFWRSLGADWQAVILPLATVRTCPAGTTLLEQADTQSIIAVEQGRVYLVSPRTHGRDLTLARLGPGEIFGRATWLQHGVAGVYAEVREPLQAWFLEREAMEKLLLERPEATTRMAKSVETLWQAAGPVGPAAGRIARLLRAWGVDHGQSGPQGMLVPGILAPAEIADLVGATREDVERCLRAWRAEGRLAEESDHFWLKQDLPAGQAH